MNPPLRVREDDFDPDAIPCFEIIFGNTRLIQTGTSVEVVLGGVSSGGGGSGTITAVGDVNTGDAFTGTSGSRLDFEGATADANEIRLTTEDPGADFTATIPAFTGTFAMDTTKVTSLDGTSLSILSNTLNVDDDFVSNSSNDIMQGDLTINSDLYVTGQANFVDMVATGTTVEIDPEAVTTGLIVRVDTAGAGISGGIHITTDDDDSSNYRPFSIYDDSGGNVDLLFDVDYQGDTRGKDLTITDFASGKETLDEILDDTLNPGVLDAVSVTDAGGLNITWTAGEVWDQPNNDVIDTVAQSTNKACTDDVINYLYWNSGVQLTLSSTAPTGTQVAVAVINCQDGDIYSVHENKVYSLRTASLEEGLGDVFPVIVTSGLIVSEHAAANAFDVDSTSGVYYHDIFEKHTVSAIDSTATNIRRWYHDGGGNWTSDTNSQIDSTQYDTGTGLAAVTAAKYYRSLFFIVEGDLGNGGADTIHWVYPDTEYNGVNQAIVGTDPTVPPGLNNHPKSTVVVLKGDDAAFPTASGNRWIDVRPRLEGNISGQITDHGNLSGLTDDDHTQYALLAGRSSGQTLVGGTAASENLTLSSTAHATKGIISTTDSFQTTKTVTGLVVALEGGTNDTLLSAGSPTEQIQFRLPLDTGDANEVLKTDGGGTLDWTADPTFNTLTLSNALTVPNGGTGATTLTDGGILLGSGTGAITALGVASNGQIPIGDGATDPVLATITAVANETNVTNGAGSITIGIVDPLIVGKGGTGAASLTDGGIVLGSGSAAVTVLGQATNGQIPIGSTGSDPSLGTITGGTNLTIVNGAGSITGNVDDAFLSNATDDVAVGVMTFQNDAWINGTATLGSLTTTGTVSMLSMTASNTVTGLVVALEGGTNDTLIIAGSPSEQLQFRLPQDSGDSGEFLGTDGGGIWDWATVTASAAGASTEIQYRNAGSLGAMTEFTYDAGNKTLDVADDALLDLNLVNNSDSAEGLFLPQAADVSGGTAEGQIGWETDIDKLYVGDSSAATLMNPTKTFGCTFDGGGSAITSGTVVYLEIPYTGTITQSTMLADQSGSSTINIFKDSYGNYPPTDADDITGGNAPAMAAATKDQDSTLTNWTTSFTKGEVFGFMIRSVTTHERVHLHLQAEVD